MKGRNKISGVEVHPYCSNKACTHNKNKICDICPCYSDGLVCRDNTANNEVYFDSDRMAHVRRTKK